MFEVGLRMSNVLFKNMDEWKRPRHTKNEDTVYREWWMYVFLDIET
jgi:hypothetical protein